MDARERSKRIVAEGAAKRVRVGWGVAVAGWQLYESIEEIKAVRMVPVSLAGCGCGGGWVAGKMDGHIKFNGCARVKTLVAEVLPNGCV
jgi:hypothetical protein